MKSLLWLLILLTGTAQAQYLVIGAGQANLKSVNKDNLWQQEGFGHENYEQTPTYKIGFGYKINRWLSAEVDYRNLGNYSSTALWVGDAKGAGQYNPTTRHCNVGCEPTSNAGVHGRTDGFGVSLVAAPDWDIAPLLRLGAFYYRSSFNVDIVFGTLGDHQTQLQHLDTDGRSSFNSSGISPMVGVGVRARWLEIEATYFPKVGSGVSPYLAVTTLTASVRKEF